MAAKVQKKSEWHFRAYSFYRREMRAKARACRLNAWVNAIAILASSRLCQAMFLVWADLVYAFNGRTENRTTLYDLIGIVAFESWIPAGAKRLYLFSSKIDMIFGTNRYDFSQRLMQSFSGHPLSIVQRIAFCVIENRGVGAWCTCQSEIDSQR